jgi:hypothetical protein
MMCFYMQEVEADPVDARLRRASLLIAGIAVDRQSSYRQSSYRQSTWVARLARGYSA